jgi:hypothetical protein
MRSSGSLHIPQPEAQPRSLHDSDKPVVGVFETRKVSLSNWFTASWRIQVFFSAGSWLVREKRERSLIHVRSTNQAAERRLEYLYGLYSVEAE